MTAQRLAVAAAALCGLLLGACASPRSAVVDTAVDMFIEQDDSFALYRVQRDGTISFAGGPDARQERITWSDAMTSDELASLKELLRDPIWREGRRDGGRPDEGERRIDILLAGPVIRNRITVRSGSGEPEHVQAMEVLLRSASMRRLQRDLDTLPKAGELPQSR